MENVLPFLTHLLVLFWFTGKWTKGNHVIVH